jgi:Uma2 family endonuclease
MSVTTFQELDLNGTYSYADYLKWTFEERLELIKGKIFNISPAPARRHQKISRQLSLPIGNYLDGKRCEMYIAPFDLRLTPLKGKKRADNQIYTDRGCVGAPDLIIEILSPGNTKKEMRDKYEVYEENGVKEYWLVEPNDNAIFVYVLNDEGKYIGLRPFTEDDVITTSILPELEISVAKIFEP